MFLLLTVHWASVLVLSWFLLLMTSYGNRLSIGKTPQILIARHLTNHLDLWSLLDLIETVPSRLIEPY